MGYAWEMLAAVAVMAHDRGVCAKKHSHRGSGLIGLIDHRPNFLGDAGGWENHQTRSRLRCKERAMPGDPKVCREQARDCQLLAHTARTEAARQTFSNLAATWLSLASELEQRKALLDTWEKRTTLQTASSSNIH